MIDFSLFEFTVKGYQQSFVRFTEDISRQEIENQANKYQVEIDWQEIYFEEKEFYDKKVCCVRIIPR